MNKRDVVREVSLLSFSCARNIAYYRAGWKNDRFCSHDDFWRDVNSNFLDVAVLEWCKIYGSKKQIHHWSKVINDIESFQTSLFETIQINKKQFKNYCVEMKAYRDKFVEQIDEERYFLIPDLTIAVESIIFLYNKIREEYSKFLYDGPHNLGDSYQEFLRRGIKFYPQL